MDDPVDPRPDSELERIRTAFAAVAGKDEKERARHLAEVFAAEPVLRAQVEELLRYHDAPEPRLDESAYPGARHPQQIGRYRILGFLGSGGIGIVYRAEQQRPRRTVALKVLQPGQLRPETQKRFALEADLLARLQHPGIAQIHEAGSFDTGFGEAPFFAMELVEGESLTRFAHARELDVRQRCELVVQVCDAVQHAHERGIVHRDLKPDNVLVTEPDPGDPCVKVLDFGIARVVRADAEPGTLVTHTGQMVGTLPYMSPEQLSGALVDARTDVYALGAILYELLAGRVPLELEGRPLTQVVRIVTEEEPERLSRLVPDARGDLETIVAVALAKEVSRRYPSVRALRDDLRRFLAHEPIVARPQTAFYQVRKFARRNRVLVGGVLATLLSLVAGIVAVSLYSVRNRELAASERHNRYLAEMNLAGNALATGGLARVRQIVDAWRAVDAGEPDPRGFEWHFLAAASRGTERILATERVQYSVRWIDENTLATHEEGGGAVYDLASGARLARYEGKSNEFVSSAVSSDGRWIAVTHDQEIAVHDVATGALRATLVVGFHPTWLSWFPDSDRIGFLGREGRVEVWDVGTNARVSALGADGSLGFGVGTGASRCVRHLVRGGCEVMDVTSGNVLQRVAEESGAIFASALSPDGKLLACGGMSRTVKVIDLASGAEIAAIPHDKRIMTVAWSPDGRHLASGGHDCVIRVLELASGTVTRLLGHGNTVLGLAYSKDGRRLASASEDGTLRVWEPAPPSPVRRASLPERIRDEGSGARLRWLRSGAIAVNLLGASWTFRVDPTNAVTRVDGICDWSADEAFASVHAPRSSKGEASTRVAGTSPVQTDQWALPRDLEVLTAFGGPALSPDGCWLAATLQGPEGNGLWLWEPFAGRAPRKVHPGPLSNLAWKEDGRLATIAGEDLLIVDPRHDRVQRERRLERATVVCWEPGGSRLAVVDSHRRIHVLTPGTPEPVLVLRGHTLLPRALDWQPAGGRLATGGNDRVVKIWDVGAGREALSLPVEDDVCALRWRADGKALAALTADGVVTVWGTELSRGR